MRKQWIPGPSFSGGSGLGTRLMEMVVVETLWQCPDGGSGNPMAVAHSYCYKLLCTLNLTQFIHTSLVPDHTRLPPYTPPLLDDLFVLILIITINYTPGRGKIVPRNVIFTLLVGEKLCRVM